MPTGTGRSSKTAKQEPHIRDACHFLARQARNGVKPNITQAARDFKVPFGTLYGRWTNRSKSMADSALAQQFISPSKEKVLVAWLTHLQAVGAPLSKKDLRLRAQHLHPEGKKPGKNWISLFNKRHPSLVLGTGRGLDPKRAKAFNQPVVNRYFDELARILDEHEIPIENVYNMDEKGCQRGGGKKSSRQKYFFAKGSKTRYKQRSANLELVTILEAVCADGTSLKPGFVFPGKSYAPDWFEVDPEIVYVRRCCTVSSMH